MKNFILLSLLGLHLMACAPATDNKHSSPVSGEIKSSVPAVKMNPGDWGGNIALHIDKKEQLSPSLIKYHILSLYEDHQVGFNLLMTRPAGEKVFISDGISFQSIGEASNNFLKMLATIYNQAPANFIFADSIKVTYVNLLDMVEAKKENGIVIAAQYKLFFDSLNQDSSEDLSRKDELAKKRTAA